MQCVSFNVLNRRYTVPLTYNLILEIEEECGSVLHLINQFQSASWQVRDVVHVLHIILSHNDEAEEIDFLTLAEDVIAKGATSYFDLILKLLMPVIFGQNTRKGALIDDT